MVGDPADGLAEQQRARERRTILRKAGPDTRRHSNIPIGAPDIPEDDGQPDSLTRRRVTRKTAPLPDPALAKIHEQLRNEKELYRLHLKHSHMPLDQLKRRTSHLKVPKEIYDMFDSMVKKCETCISLKDKPSRSKVSGLRADFFGDLVFMDHGSIDVSQEDRKSVV